MAPVANYSKMIPKWSQLIPNGSKWLQNVSKMVTNGHKWLSNGPNWFPIGPKWFPIGPKWFLDVPQRLTIGPQWVPNGPKWFPLADTNWLKHNNWYWSRSCRPLVLFVFNIRFQCLIWTINFEAHIMEVQLNGGSIEEVPVFQAGV